MKSNWREICDDFIIATSYETSQECIDADANRTYDYSQHNPYLSFPDAKVRIPLGKPDFPEVSGLWDVISSRRSKRKYIDKPLTLNELNILLWSTFGESAEVTSNRGGLESKRKVRTVSSAGGLYPIEAYMLISKVEGITPGLYHLDVKNWELEGLKLEDVSEFSFNASLFQELTRCSAVNFVWTAVLPRCRDKYFERAYRYVLWDVGHIAQNLHISGNGLGLGVCSIGAWADGEMNEYLGIDGKEHLSILMASVGHVGGDWVSDRSLVSPPVSGEIL